MPLAPRERAIVACLAASHPVGARTTELIAAVWDAAPPATARKTLQNYIRTVRAKTVAGFVETISEGYRLGPVATVATAQPSGRVEDRPDASRVDEIVARWPPGVPFADLPHRGEFDAARTRVRTRRNQVLCDCAAAYLRVDRPADAVALARRVLEEDPYLEAAWLAVVSGLHALGRRAEATTSFLEAHRRLADIGLDPGEELRRAHLAALDPAALFRTSYGPTDRTGDLVGRQADMARLERLLATHQLVTIVGPGGVGKTRLAQAVMQQHPSAAAVWVDLAAARRSDDLHVALARVLGANPAPGQALGPEVCRLLATAAGLVLLDSADLVREDLARLLNAVTLPDTARILVTSRRRLGIPGEAVHRLDPLRTTRGEGEEHSEAALLLRSRLRAQRHAEEDGDALAAIARRVEGLPLALELAAARLAVVPAAAVLTELGDRLAFADRSGVRPERHHTMGQTIRWTVDRLDMPQRRAMRVLATLPGGARPDLLDHLGLFDEVVELAEASVAYLDVDAGRYRMLDTVRELALSDVVPELTEDLTRQVLTYHVDLARGLDARMRTSDEPRAAQRMEQEITNLHAVHVELGRRGRSDQQVWLAAQTMCFVGWRSRPDVSAWAHEAITGSPHRGLPGFCRATGVAGWGPFVSGGTSTVISMVDQALAACPPAHQWEAAELATLAAHALAAEGHLENALGRLEANAARVLATGNTYAGAMNQGAMAMYGAMAARPREWLMATASEARELAAGTGVPSLLGWTWYATGLAHMTLGEIDVAREALAEALTYGEQSGAATIEAVARATWTGLAQGLDHEEKLRALVQALRRTREAGHDIQAIASLPWLFEPLSALGKHEAVLLGERLVQRYGRGGQLPQAPGYRAAVDVAKASLGPRAAVLLARTIRSLPDALDAWQDEL